MAHILIMPRQGNTVESCIIQEWKVSEGENVKADTPVCVVETDKASFDIPAGADGQVLKLLYPDGEDVPVLEPIAVIGAAGEDWQAILGTVAEETSRGGAETQGKEFKDASRRGAEAQGEEFKDVSHSGTAAQREEIKEQRAESRENYASPRARKLAQHKGISAETVQGTGPGGRVLERDIQAALAGRSPLTAAALAAAGEGKTAPAFGSGLGGRITAADMIIGLPEIPGVSGTSLAIIGEGSVTETPIKGIRKIIADRMITSLSQSAQFTLNANASAVQLEGLRKQLKNAGESLGSDVSKITINDLVLFAVSRVLPSYLFMNSHKIDDLIVTYERVHLGMAVDTPRGLMVPVIKNANLLPLRHISAEAKRLNIACQDGTVKPDELSGSTFTVSNLGAYGITSFTPVLNLPEAAILGVCGIELKPVKNTTDGSGISFEPHIGFSLTINHQAVDGAPAARFLNALCKAVAEINVLLALG